MEIENLEKKIIYLNFMFECTLRGCQFLPIDLIILTTLYMALFPCGSILWEIFFYFKRPL